MKIYYSINEFAIASINKSVVTQGTFDGVHIGHRKILARIKELAEKNGAESVLLTFEPHPRTVIYGETGDLYLLSTPEEKAELLEKAGIQHLVIHPFTKELSRLSAHDYVNEILVKKFHAKTLVTGHDHRFGKNREGTINDLKDWAPEMGFNVEEIEPFQLNGVTISSTKIRVAISSGDMPLANAYLGYKYSIKAKVVQGKQLGRRLGYPTANLEIQADLHTSGTGISRKLVPADGIYAVYVQIMADSKEAGTGNWLKGMMNIGLNPTIKDKGRSMEVHIFNFNETIYNKFLNVAFYKKIREEEKFNSLDDLKYQLDRDRETAIGLLKDSKF